MDLRPQTQKEILIVFLFAASAISFLSYFNFAGYAGEYLDNALRAIFGIDRLILPISFLFIGFTLLYPEKFSLTIKNWVGFALLILSTNGLIHLIASRNAIFENLEQGGGYAGMILAAPLSSAFGLVATIITLASIFIISVILSFNTDLKGLFAPFSSIFSAFAGAQNIFNSLRFKKLEAMPAEPNAEYLKNENSGFKTVEVAGDRVPADNISGSPIKMPLVRKASDARKKIDIPLGLLSNTVTKPSAGDIKMNSEKIKKTLENFGIPVEMGPISVGPTVAQYTLAPAEGIKLSRITSLSNDLALALAAHPIRIEAPIPGKSLVGVEVPNHTIATVRMREILESPEYKQRKTDLSIGLGKDVAGKIWTADLGKMPHLLVAGTTGSGKTICLLTIITCLLYQNSPDNLKFILIDPKRVELPVFNGIPHLITPVVTQVPKIVNALKWTILEMDRRLELLSRYKKRDITAFNKETGEKMPYLVVVIDELADLMVAAASEVEGCVVRLAQMARAVGIHLVIATQRPSVDVITGLIKANITSRIAFAVGSMIDSRTILDTSGAEKLLGRGDMLFTSSELSKPKRLQGAFISDEELIRIANFIKSENETPEYVEEVTEKINVSSLGLGPTVFGARNASGFDEDDDPLLEGAKDVIIQAGKASASLLQRRLKVGYSRAARLLDIMEKQGLIGPSDGAKPREILGFGKPSAGHPEHEHPEGESKYEEYEENPDNEEEYYEERGEIEPINNGIDEIGDEEYYEEDEEKEEKIK
jgi:S-DNA-T family DNA segregation ATPase FtsK/SpoIIIE